MLTPENAVAQIKQAADTAARQRALRERRAANGLAEVRGIYASPEHHARIKAYAAKLARPSLTKSPPTERDGRRKSERGTA